MEHKGWIGVDLDGTLAKDDHWEGIDHIGEPIEPMVTLVKNMLAEGKTVKIFTARVSPQAVEMDRDIARSEIQRWCEKHIGVKLEVTHEKDFGMIMLYDDRCVQVEKNTGRLIGATLCLLLSLFAGCGSRPPNVNETKIPQKNASGIEGGNWKRPPVVCRTE